MTSTVRGGSNVHRSEDVRLLLKKPEVYVCFVLVQDPGVTGSRDQGPKILVAFSPRMRRTHEEGEDRAQGGG